MCVSVSVCLSVCAEIDGGEGPLISGMRDRYELNAELNVNCTAPAIETNSGHPLAQQLSWQFNKRPVRLDFSLFIFILPRFILCISVCLLFIYCYFFPPSLPALISSRLAGIETIGQE